MLYNRRQFPKKVNKHSMLHNYLSYFRILVVLLVGGLSASLGWAGTPDGLTPEQEAALEQRVRERWQTLIEKDFDNVWQFSTPTFREVFSKSMYVHNFSYAVDWELTSIDVVNYHADAAVASVAVGVMSRSTKHVSSASRALGAVPITIREKWILADGEWWHSTNE